MKKLISKCLIAVLCLGLLLFVSGCGEKAPDGETLSRLVADAILSQNKDMYLEGECCGEGHSILGTDLSGKSLKVYALTMFGNYGFENDMFVKVSGSGVIPAVLSFEKNGDDYKLLKIEYPEDGANYSESIQRLFPKKYHAQVLSFDEAQNAALNQQERSYAEAYLKSIGREAAIGEFQDLNVVLLTDQGVDVEVSNRLISDPRLQNYPYWIGTNEFLSNGKRCVRSLSLDNSAGQILYETVEKDSGTVTERFVFDAATGEELTGD